VKHDPQTLQVGNICLTVGVDLREEVPLVNMSHGVILRRGVWWHYLGNKVVNKCA